MACALISAGPISAQEKEGSSEDLLRFQNGDSLHGKFLGMSGSDVRWRHAEARDKIELKTGKLRRISLNGGRSRKSLQSPSFVRLNDGDRVPGTIKTLDAENLVIETEFAGTLTIPRGFISEIAPRPHGGLVHYIGPFSENEWTVIEPEENEEEDAEKKKGEPEVGAEKGEKAEENPAKKVGEDEEKEEDPWVFSGGAFYSNGQLPIAIDTKAGDQARIRFTLAWRNRLNAAIAFHATMKRPEIEKEEDAEKEDEKAKAPRPGLQSSGTSSFAYTYGHSYVLTIYSNYAQVYRCDFNKDGEADMDRLSNSSANLRLEDTGQADFELRCDRKEGTIALFANGRFVSQWNDEQGYVGSGSHLAFAAQSTTSRLRISDVVVTAWNGMMDSAQSMETEDRDVVLLTNGTDRFSGEVLSLKDGKFLVKGTYAEMTVPQDDVQEIRFARAKQTGEDEEEASRQSVRLLMQPYGRLTLRPTEANSELMKAHHPAMGDLTLNLNYTGLLEFSFSRSVLDSWDDDY